MDNQHDLIKGYRDLTQEEINMMNTVKDKAEHIRVLVEELKKIPSLDQRWVAIGTTNLQQGFMALVRAIAKPTTF